MSQLQSIWQLYLFLGILVGAGSNTYVPILSTVARWFVGKRGMMTGITFSGVGFGMLVMPLVINQLISVYNWRISFLVLGIIVLVVVVVIARFLKRDPGQVGESPYGDGGDTEEHSVSAGEDFSPGKAARTAQFWMFVAALFCYGFCFFSIQVHLAPYLTDLGISAATAATVLAIVGGATIVGQLGLGSAADKLGFKRAFLIGVILITLAAIMLMFGRELWAFILLAVFLGLAFGDCSTVESPMAAWLFGLASHGVILGFLAFSFTVGAAIGPLLFGYIFDITGSYQIAFSVCTVLAVIAVVLTLLVRRPVARSV
jgi:MFS family permease